MGDLLGYWRRENSAVAMKALLLSTAPDTEQMESMGAIARLKYVGRKPQHHAKTGKELKWEAAVFTFPPQPIDADIKPGETLILAMNDREWEFFKVASIDRRKGELRVVWDKKRIDSGVIPSSLVHFVRFDEKAKRVALQQLGDEMLAGDASRVGHSMLRRELPKFVAGGGPAGGQFTRAVEDICGWVTQLDGSFVPIQGPPGSGKTFTGAHIIRTLVKAGKRVGVTAMSHHAIDNLMEAVVERFVEDGDVGELRAVRKSKPGDLDHVEYIDDNGDAAGGDFNVLAGTPWFFASTAMRDNPVDVLVVDEAGQLGLADTLAATISAANVILLGDPQQLPQVSQASHPNGAGASALEHILGDDRTVSADRGVLLDVTWRMHPRVCKFISDTSYEGKLTSHESCAGQSTAAGVGLRWIRADHAGRSTESPEEAELVAKTIGDLMGKDWTDQKGVTRPLTADDFIVVTPYNDQRRLIESVLAADRSMAEGVRGRHGRQVPGPRGRGGGVLDGDVVEGLHAAHVRLPVLEEPTQRGDQPGEVPRLPDLHRRPARHAGAHGRGDGADLRAVLVRRTGEGGLKVVQDRSRTSRRPDSIWPIVASSRVVTRSSRWRLSRVRICDTLTTESLRSPERSPETATLPGARSRSRLLDIATTTTVLIALALNESADTTTTGRRYPGDDPAGAASDAHRTSPRRITDFALTSPRVSHAPGWRRERDRRCCRRRSRPRRVGR